MNNSWKMPKYRNKKTQRTDDIVTRLIRAQERAARLEAAAMVAIDLLPKDPERSKEVLKIAVNAPPPLGG